MTQAELMPLLDIKALDEDGHFEGYAAVFGNVDQGGDRIEPGAFKASLKKRPANQIKLLWQHDPKQPIGVVESLEEDAKGLKIRGRLLRDVKRADEAYALIKTGAMDGLSIGFRVVDSEYDRKTQHRVIKEMDLWEVSVVTFPMNTSARIFSVKAGAEMSADDFETFLCREGGFTAYQAKQISTHGIGVVHRNGVHDKEGILDAIGKAVNALKS